MIARPIQANPIGASVIQANPIGIVGPSYPAILDTAIVLLDDTTLNITGPDVTGWTNKGVGGIPYDLTAFTSGSILPQISTFNGQNVVVMNVASDRRWFTPAAGISLTQPYTTILVAKQDTQPVGQHVYFDAIAGGSRSFIQSVVTDLEIQSFNGNILNAGTNSSTLVPRINTLVSDGPANSRIRISDVADVTGNSGLDSWTYCTLGANLNTFNGVDGWFHAFIVFNTALAMQDIIDIETYYKGVLGI